MPQEDLKVLGPTDKRGTTVTFLPDKEIFETTHFNYDTIRAKFRETAFLNSVITISIEDDRNDEPHKESFHFEGGVDSS